MGIRIRGIALAVVAVAPGAVRSAPIRAQQPATPQTPQIAAYRPPAIVLVQPADGGTIPQDKPVVAFRFAPGEPGDALDLSTFRVAADGVDQSNRFQLSASEAWGALVSSAPDEPIAAGSHQVAARICSSRGACGETQATVSVVPPLTPADSTGLRRPSRRERVIDALLAAVKRLLQQP